MKTHTISVVLPCYNEAAIIERTILQVINWMKEYNIHGEIIVVDDGSKDGSDKLIDSLHRQLNGKLTILHHAHNKGYGAALRTGCDAAKMDVIAFMDSDGQFNIRELNAMLPLLESIEMVAGIRKERSDNMVRKTNALLWNTLMQWTLRLHAKDIDCGLKIFNRHIWPTIRPVFATGNFFGAELFFRLERNNIPYAQVPVTHYWRRHGKASGARLHVIYRAFKEFSLLLWDIWLSKSSAQPRLRNRTLAHE
ncbi:MAG: glycosyltransferase family 2 protein [Candidatus Peribacteraceae bacterium]|jgi:glycosyltransferase involved in cell wall biosynthesis